MGPTWGSLAWSDVEILVEVDWTLLLDQILDPKKRQQVILADGSEIPNNHLGCLQTLEIMG